MSEANEGTGTVPHRRNAQTLLATVVGNWLEFFDFGVYTFFAVMIGKQFFPVKSEFGQLLLSLTAFGVGAASLLRFLRPTPWGTTAAKRSMLRW